MSGFVSQGMPFALVDIKMVIMTLVNAFQCQPCSGAIIKMEYDKSINVKPKNGLWLNVKRRWIDVEYLNENTYIVEYSTLRWVW